MPLYFSCRKQKAVVLFETCCYPLLAARSGAPARWGIADTAYVTSEDVKMQIPMYNVWIPHGIIRLPLLLGLSPFNMMTSSQTATSVLFLNKWIIRCTETTVACHRMFKMRAHLKATGRLIGPIMWDGLCSRHML